MSVIPGSDIDLGVCHYRCEDVITARSGQECPRLPPFEEREIALRACGRVGKACCSVDFRAVKDGKSGGAKRERRAVSTEREKIALCK